MTLLETLRALAPVVTRGPQRGRVTEQLAAKAAIRRVCTEHLPAIIAALKVVDMVRDEDWLAEKINDSLDVDWRPIDAARSIIAAMGEEG